MFGFPCGNCLYSENPPTNAAAVTDSIKLDIGAIFRFPYSARSDIPRFELVQIRRPSARENIVIGFVISTNTAMHSINNNRCLLFIPIKKDINAWRKKLTNGF